MGEFILIPRSKLSELENKIELLISIATENAGKSRQIGDWIPETEAQSLLGLKTTTLWTMRKLGKIEWRKINRRVYYSKQSIQKLLETGKG